MLVLGVFRRDHSFTWIVTSLGFSASVLLGAMAGHLLRARLTAPRRLLSLVLLGLACLAGGWLWSYSLPLNRHLWTSSMILWAGGWSFLLLALFHAVIDVGEGRALGLSVRGHRRQRPAGLRARRRSSDWRSRVLGAGLAGRASTPSTRSAEFGMRSRAALADSVVALSQSAVSPGVGRRHPP